jgi:hypothetical protein
MVLMIVLLTAFFTMLPLALKVHVLEYDEAIRMDLVRNIQRFGLPLRSLGSQGIFDFDHINHLYLYLLSLYVGPSEGGILAARWMTVLFALTSVALTFAIGCRLSDWVGGGTAAMLLAVHPFFALYGFFVREEVPMVTALLGGLWLLLENRMLGAGILLAVAALCREMAILFTSCCAVYVWWRGRGAWHKGWLNLSALVVPTALAWASWALWAWKLSPAAFKATIQRWLNSAAAAHLLDPRARVGMGDWAQQLIFDLLGPAIAVGMVMALMKTLTNLKGRLTPERALLWGYAFLSLSLSFAIRLKEPRHWIALVPVATLLIGVSLDWRGLVNRIRCHPAQPTRFVLVAATLLFFLLASPLRLPAGPWNRLTSWLDPLYGWRLLENDHFYRVFQLAGEYLQRRTRPNEVITVAHQATVVAYYADRPYVMLYTLSREAIDAALARTRYLVWDDPIFLALTPSEVADLRQEIQRRFRVEEVIRDGDREVLIYR